jgi:hypothetical protein
MRYHLDSELPINAFSPRGGCFARGMTLEGGGGGGLLGGVTSALGGIAKGITGAVKGVVQPVYNATLKNIPGVDSALVSLDKSVGKAIPGGWGTVAAVASSFIPGAQLAAMGMTQTGLATGLGALAGSGVMHKGNQFNLQGAILGGAMAYGASTLSQGLQNTTPTTGTDKLVAENILSSNSGSALTGTGSAGADAGLNISANGPGASMNTVGSGAGTGVGMGTTSAPVGISAPATTLPGLDSTVPASSYAQTPPSMLENVTSGIKNLPGNIADKATSAFNTVTNPETYSNLGTSIADTTKGTLSNMGDAASGLKGVITGASSLPATVGLTNTALPMIIGGTGLKSLEEQQKYLDQQAAAGAVSNAEYNASKAKIDAQVETARRAMAENPLQSDVDISNVSSQPTSYAKNSNTLYENLTTKPYAEGGTVVNPPDDQTRMPNQSPMSNIDQRGIMSMIGNTAPQQMYAVGGIATGRFLSGGGDGMSDSIPANINGSQEARLADGEFVIPADVVSHLGNGSSKAGAKQLYSMMDKVRSARTGTKKQGKQINPRKYLAA